MNVRLASAPPKAIKILGYGEGNHNLLAQDGAFLRGPRTIAGGEVFACNYVYKCEPREGDSGGGAMSSDGFAGVISHVDPEGREGYIVGPEAVKDFIVRECAGQRRCAITPFGIFCSRRWTDPPNYAQQSAPSYPVPPASVSAEPRPGPAMAGAKGEKGDQGIQGLHGAVGAKGADGTNGKDADPAALNALTAQVNALTANMTKLTTAVQALQNQPASSVAFPPIYLKVGNQPAQVFQPQTDPSGKPFYAIQLTPTQLAPTTAPVTTIPSPSPGN
jgi:hypothetical protein